MTPESLLEVVDLRVHFPVGGGLLKRADQHVKAVDGVSFVVPRGTTFGIAGESGSGKTTTALAVMRLVKHTGGRILLGDSDIGQAQGQAPRS
jgi:peptide/nickel transport system ATP-binding protein